MSIMVRTLPPAGSTSPTLATRYWMRPSRGATNELSAMLTREQLDLMLGRSEGVLGLQDARRGGMQGGGGAVELLPSLIEQFLRRIASLKEVAGAVELLLRQLDLRLLLLLHRARFVDRPLRLQLLRLGLLERRFEVLGIHAGHDLARHAPCRPRRPGVRPARPANLVSMLIWSASMRPLLKTMPAGNAVLRLLPPVVRTAARGETDRNDGERNSGPPSPLRRWSRDGQGRRHLGTVALSMLGGWPGRELGTTGDGIPRRLVPRFGFLDQCRLHATPMTPTADAEK